VNKLLNVSFTFIAAAERFGGKQTRQSLRS